MKCPSPKCWLSIFLYWCSLTCRVHLAASFGFATDLSICILFLVAPCSLLCLHHFICSAVTFDGSSHLQYSPRFYYSICNVSILSLCIVRCSGMQNSIVLFQVATGREKKVELCATEWMLLSRDFPFVKAMCSSLRSWWLSYPAG